MDTHYEGTIVFVHSITDIYGVSSNWAEADTNESAVVFLRRLNTALQTEFRARMWTHGSNLKLEITGNKTALEAARHIAKEIGWQQAGGRVSINKVVHIQKIPHRHSDANIPLARVDWTRENMLHAHSPYVNREPIRPRKGSVTGFSNTMSIPIEKAAAHCANVRFSLRRRKRPMRTPISAHESALELEHEEHESMKK